MRAETGQPFYSGKIETQAGSPYLHSQTCLRLRFCAQRTIAGTCVGAPIHFAGQTVLFVDAIDAGGSIGEHVILRKESGGGRQDCNTEIAERIELCVASKLLAEQHLAVGVRLIQSDTAGLVGVGKLYAKLKSQRRSMTGFVTQLDLGREREIAKIVCRGCPRSYVQRNCRRSLRVYAEEILRYAFNLNLYIG